jgi:hypothetical protein
VTRTPELAFATFLLGVAVLVATATTEEPAPRRLARLRVGNAFGAALLIGFSLVRPVVELETGAACLGLLLSVQAIWLGLRHQADLRAWHDEFERPFAEYVARR